MQTIKTFFFVMQDLPHLRQPLFVGKVIFFGWNNWCNLSPPKQHLSFINLQTNWFVFEQVYKFLFCMLILIEWWWSSLCKSKWKLDHSKKTLQLAIQKSFCNWFPCTWCFKLELNGRAMWNPKQVHSIGHNSLFHTTKYFMGFFPLNIWHVHGIINVYYGRLWLATITMKKSCPL